MQTTRRRLVALGVTGVLGGLAGCGKPGGQANAGGSGSRLGYVRVANWHKAAHTVHVLIERDGDPVHWSSHDLQAGNDRVQTQALEHTWSSEAGSFVVFVRLDDRSTWKRFDVTEQSGNCYGVEARINQDGSLGLWYENAPPECERGGTRTSN